MRLEAGKRRKTESVEEGREAEEGREKLLQTR